MLTGKVSSAKDNNYDSPIRTVPVAVTDMVRRGVVVADMVRRGPLTSTNILAMKANKLLEIVL